MMDELHPLIQLAVLVLGPTGAVWVSVKASLNGMREDVRELKHDMKDVRERVARLEAGVCE